MVVKHTIHLDLEPQVSTRYEDPFYIYLLDENTESPLSLYWWTSHYSASQRAFPFPPKDPKRKAGPTLLKSTPRGSLQLLDVRVMIYDRGQAERLIPTPLYIWWVCVSQEIFAKEQVVLRKILFKKRLGREGKGREKYYFFGGVQCGERGLEHPTTTIPEWSHAADVKLGFPQSPRQQRWGKQGQGRANPFSEALGLF